MKRIIAFLIFLFSLSILAATPEEVRLAKAAYSKSIKQLFLHAAKINGAKELTVEQNVLFEQAVERNTDRVQSIFEKQGELDFWAKTFVFKYAVPKTDALCKIENPKKFRKQLMTLQNKTRVPLQWTQLPEAYMEIAKSIKQMRTEVAPIFTFPEGGAEAMRKSYTYTELVVHLSEMCINYRREFIERFSHAAELCEMPLNDEQKKYLERAAGKFFGEVIYIFDGLGELDSFTLFSTDPEREKIHQELMRTKNRTDFSAVLKKYSEYIIKMNPNMASEEHNAIFKPVIDDFRIEIDHMPGKNVRFNQRSEFDFWRNVILPGIRFVW